ncbi:MAG TPA: hypothetical protein VF261_00695 [Candidatus Saccharimonadales bacterium]
MSVSAKRVPYFAIAVLLFAAVAIPLLLHPHRVDAAQITKRSLTLQDGTVPGSAPGDGNTADTVNHLFTFTLPTTGTAVKSISFQYCTTADIDVAGGNCTTPAGLVTTAATLGTEGGDATGFDTLHNSTNGDPYLSSTGGVTPTAGTSDTIQLLGIQNPDDTNCGGSANCTFFVRITTYTSSDATTGATDAGTVAASTSTQIVLTGTMPESLIFCTGQTVSANCTTAATGDITFNKLFSPTGTAFATSQLAASTNANHGYAITVSGPPLTSGTNYIHGTNGTGNAAVSSTATVGTSVFGLNLVSDTDAAASTPALSPASASIAPTSDGANYWGAASANFNTDSNYAFTESDSLINPGLELNDIASSDYSQAGTAEPTDGQVYTVTYMVNAAANQPAGSYSTTLTYICTPTF